MTYNETWGNKHKVKLIKREISKEMETLTSDERNKSKAIYTTSVGNIIWYTSQLALVEKSIPVENSQWIDFMPHSCPC